MMRRRLAALLLGVGLLAACGSSASKSAPLSTTASTETAAPTTPLPADPCKSTKSAAIAASAVFYANTNCKYPTTFTDLTDPKNPLLELNDRPDPMASPALSAELISPRTIKNDGGWTLTMAGGGNTQPTFECS
jgi:hypothetical protein